MMGKTEDRSAPTVLQIVMDAMTSRLLCQKLTSLPPGLSVYRSGWAGGMNGFADPEDPTNGRCRLPPFLTFLEFSLSLSPATGVAPKEKGSLNPKPGPDVVDHAIDAATPIVNSMPKGQSPRADIKIRSRDRSLHAATPVLTVRLLLSIARAPACDRISQCKGPVCSRKPNVIGRRQCWLRDRSGWLTIFASQKSNHRSDSDSLLTTWRYARPVTWRYALRLDESLAAAEIVCLQGQSIPSSLDLLTLLVLH